ncbi:Cytosolic endo-beta-N-acetylglucosaminidase [Morus notabilis]|uniref:mannosyl-glycoprotein endo-beta-N-acetylglucosaminidase n=1 Tax=Morus notabilis TaxID=981085 RepID=W9QN56_9ROSA|nr:Cytosolic endo-beta-N-acetylglucosaminidase [Morus notabilis]
MSKIGPEPELQSSASDSTTFDPTKPSVPISYPIKTLEELESRSYFESFHYPFNRASVPLQSGTLPNRPRLLVCHDMAGGYGDDKWVQGGTNPEAFDLSHWYLMDVFVYFSHNLVALPPPCWTNTAHLHGVKVLGTFITEWDEGRVIANKLLSTKESSQMYAERLAELAVALGFDGWLLNMEVSLGASKIPNLKEFVSHLTQKMHSSIPGSLVIWYDSITIDGNLNWQDQLNEKNKPFFDVCDGIFVNYTWKDLNVCLLHYVYCFTDISIQESYPSLSAAAAGDRKYDVYMGIDVFGRGTFGGGQWNTNVALDVLKKDDVSAALFAPGWVYESKQPPDYQTAKTHWWSLVEKSWGVAQHYPKTLPFSSNFDQGHGYHFSVDGEQVLDTPWNNISCQGFQPHLEFKPADAIQVLVDFKEPSYGGGSSITFKGNLEEDSEFRNNLFSGELHLQDSPLHLTYSVKSDSNSLLGLCLEFYSLAGERKSVLLAPREANRFSSTFNEVVITRQLEHLGTSQGWVVHKASIKISGQNLTKIGFVCYRPESRIVQRTSNRSSTEYYAVLGHISIKTSEHNLQFPPAGSWLVEGHYTEWDASSKGSKTVSVKITWKLKDGNGSAFPKYNIYAEKIAGKVVPGQAAAREFLGVALVEAFYVASFAVDSDNIGVKFIIQVCGIDGSSQKVDDSPFYRLEAPKAL